MEDHAKDELPAHDGASGSTFDGTRNARGERDGSGVWSHADGRGYDGEWLNGRRHGKGRMRYSDGTVYSGSYTHGLRDGHGHLSNASGFTYEGEWREGKMSGKGRMSSSHGQHGQASYEGTFADGKLSGLGRMDFTLEDEASHYEGEWRHGLREGRGSCRSMGSGLTYSGEWRADLRHGHGTLTTAEGKVIYRGEWRDGRQVSWNFHRVRQFAGWYIARVVCPACGVAVLVSAVALVAAVLLAAPPT